MRAVFLREVEKVEEPYILITYTDTFGTVPITTQNFLHNNSQLLLGVASSGNRRWHETYCKAADVISDEYGIPVISKFELSGNVDTIKSFIERVGQIDYSVIRKHELLRA